MVAIKNRLSVVLAQRKLNENCFCNNYMICYKNVQDQVHLKILDLEQSKRFHF